MSSPEPVITSFANPRVKSAARLRDRGERDARGLTIVDGVRELGRALEAGIELVEAFVCPALVRTPEAGRLVETLRVRRAPVVRVTEPVFARLAFGERAEGVVGVVRVPPLGLEGLRLPVEPLIVVVEGIEKPGNLGAILRSADGARADALVAADARTDLFNPNAIRASLGTIFSVPLAEASSAELVPWLRERRIRTVAARVDAARLHTDVSLTGPLAVALGSEAGGLSDAWEATDIVAVRLPMLGVADSLNVSVAAAVLLYEARRQRGLR